MLNFFSPKPGRFGTQPVYISRRLNTGTLAAGTLTFHLAGLPRKAIVSGLTYSATTFPDATTSVTAQLIKRDVSASADVNLTGLTDVDNKTAQAGINVNLTTTLTDQQRLLDTNDTLKVSLVTTGTVSTQPVDLTVTVELLLLN